MTYPAAAPRSRAPAPIGLKAVEARRSPGDLAGVGATLQVVGADLTRALVLAVPLALAASEGAVAQDHKAQGMTVDAIKWGPAPPVLPSGGQMAGLSGEAGKAGPFTIRLRMPAAYKIPAHRHPHNERVTVISGELSFGTGDKIDEKKAEKLGPGGFVDLPANVDHFAFATAETVIQISAEGPFGIKYVNPADDPSRTP